MRRIYAASRQAEQFGELHDTADYERNRAVFDKIYSILDKYSESDNESVITSFDKASQKDKETLMQLARSMFNSKPDVLDDDDDFDYGDIANKYRDLNRRSDKLSQYEQGYLDALNAVLEEFNLDF